jgi:Zn-finger protein
MDNYKYFSNKKCEYYPCHKGLEEMNCLFCYCPLYLTECSGNYTILDNGIKDCSNCSIPHDRNNYDYIIARLSEKMRRPILCGGQLKPCKSDCTQPVFK